MAPNLTSSLALMVRMEVCLDMATKTFSTIPDFEY